MGRNVFYARKTVNGGRCCSFSRRGMNMNAKAKTTLRGQAQKEEEVNMPSTIPIATITSGRSIPTNKEVEKHKAKMNTLINKLQNATVVKKKNISFEI